MDTIKFVIEEHIDEEFGYRFPILNIYINDRNLIHLVSAVENKCPVEEAAEDPWGYIGFELSNFERFHDEILGKKIYPRSILLTCTCTIPECNCIMADIAFEKDTVVWKNIENPWLVGPTPSPWVGAEEASTCGWVPLDYANLKQFSFERKQYLAALDELSKRVIPRYYR
jgi:hypothetical protein